MPIASARLLPGVTTDLTSVANEAGIQQANLIRFREYAQQGVYAEKMGGWSKYYGFPYAAAPRALNAWQGLNNDQYLGVGTASTLAAIRNGTSKDLTPQSTTSNVAVSLTTVSGTATVAVTDASTNLSIYDVVVFNTPVSVGGLIISGAYQVTAALGANSYQITATSNATGSVTNGGTIPSFATTSGSAAVTVTLAGHGQTNGSSVAFAIPTTGNGVTISGFYTVSNVTTNTYVINASTLASATSSFSMNGGNAQIVHWIGVGPSLTGSGYGLGGFGKGTFGSGVAPPAHTGTPITATDWSLDNWGEVLVACPENGPVFIWDPNSAFRTAIILPNAPLLNTGAFVAMPQQMIVTYGSSVLGAQDPLQVAWCDAGNYGVWRASSTNQAGTFHIPTGSKIVGGIQAPQQGLLWTDLDLWSMQYLGPPLVWGFNKIASGCGLIGKHARAQAGNAVFWMSQNQFFRVQGGEVAPIPCPVWDVVFQNFNRTYAWKVHCGSNARFNEVIWFYPSASATENDSYVKFNYVLGTWDYGTLARSAWIDQSVVGGPVAASPAGYIYAHETGYDDDGSAMLPFLESGWFSLADGDQMSFVDWMMPDMKFGQYPGTGSATLSVTLSVANYPGDTPVVLGPYTVVQATQYINTRLRGRLVKMRISSADLGSFWRVGRIRYRIASDGRVGGP